MITPQEKRMQLAQQNAARFAQNKQVIGILLAGSVSRGTADTYSDIDCSIYYASPPSEAEFEALCDQAVASGGGVFGGTAASGFAVYEYINGIKCDFGHIAFDQVTQQLQKLIDNPPLEGGDDHIFLSGFYDGLPLYGSDLISSWQRKLDSYPTELADGWVQKHLRFSPRWVLETMGFARGDIAFVQETLLEATNNIFNILCGLNHIYPPGKLKGMAWSIRKMTHKPPNLLTRLENMFQLCYANIDQTVAELYQLIDETLTLVETHMPHIDTSRSRTIIKMVLAS